jgi:hypothetical protein
MNANDKHNLDFLLNGTPESISIWYNQADADDIKYALELMARAALEFELLTDPEPQLDLTEANSVLAKFRLQK